MEKSNLIYNFIFGNDDATNLQRFEVAWDIYDKFGDMLRKIKEQIALEIQSKLKSEFNGQDLEVVNTFTEGYWYKHYAGVFIKFKDWMVDEHDILVGLQAENTEFNYLYVCFKYPHELADIFADYFPKLDTAKHWSTMKRMVIENELFRDPWTSDFFRHVITAEGRKEAVEFYVGQILDFYQIHEDQLRLLLEKSKS